MLSCLILYVAGLPPNGAQLVEKPTSTTFLRPAHASEAGATTTTRAQKPQNGTQRKATKHVSETVMSDRAESSDTKLPPHLPIGRPTEVPVRGDRNLRVTHASGDTRHAIMYLHGMCGNPKGADPWADIAARYGTLVTLRANVPCPSRPGYKWPRSISAIQDRIQRALSVVRKQRNGHLLVDRVTIFGYSQGAHRAERLSSAYPSIYQRVVLGGPPTRATPERLRHAKRVAILGGQLENTRHMLDSYLELTFADIESDFFLLPNAHHGSYGPQGRQIVSQLLTFLFPDRSVANRPLQASP